MKRNKTISVIAAILISNSLCMPLLAQTSTLSDAQVAHAAVTANQIDIAFAEIAKERSKDAGVIDFANTMQRDHNAVIGQAVTLAGKLNVTPVDNAVSIKLLKDAEATKKNLRSVSGKAFDRAYINNEVSYHKAVISVVQSFLIPETENVELKNFLEGVLPALKAHLMHAEMLQKKYK